MGCHECGAPERDGHTCRQQWDELLALEFSDARAASVHFLTVACYQLQHPNAFPLHAEARRWLENALREVVLHARARARSGTRSRTRGSTPMTGPTWAAAVHADLDRHDADGADR